MHEIRSPHAEFHAMWTDRKLYEVVTADAGVRIGDDVRVVEILPAREGRPVWPTGRFVHARVSHLSLVDRQPGKVILGLFKVSQGDTHLLTGR